MQFFVGPFANSSSCSDASFQPPRISPPSPLLYIPTASFFPSTFNSYNIYLLATMPLSPSILALILILLTSSSLPLAEKQNLLLKKLPKRAHYPCHGRSCSVPQKSRTGNGAIVLEMKHVDELGIRVGGEKALEETLIADDIRVRSIQSRIKGILLGQLEEDYSSSSHTQIPVNSGVRLHTLNYVVGITLGGWNLTVIVDTGSDLTWVQCQPCRLCYTQPEPLFNPLTSPSYKPVQCHSAACQTMPYAAAGGNSRYCGDGEPVCSYAVSYGDGSYTRGDLGSDRAVLGAIPIDNFVFGCGRNNRGLFGAASGLMGLGRSDLSLISQTMDLFDGVFSYCLPDTEAAAAASGALVLGSDASVYRNTTAISYTRLGTNPQLYSFYIVNMTGISIGGVALESPTFGNSGFLIDSGTVISRLPPSIYRAFKAEFLKQFAGYPRAPGFSILDTCFNLSAYEEVSIPTVGMGFEGGVEMTVDVSGMFYFAKRDASQVCLALASLAYEAEIGIIGNFQQRNTRVVFDTKAMKLGFAKEICSFS